MLKKNSDLWNEIACLLHYRKLSYGDIIRKLQVTKDQVKYVATKDKIYKTPSRYIFSNDKTYTLVKNLIKDYDKKNITYSKIIEVWYINKKPQSLTSPKPNIILRHISKIVDEIKKPIPEYLISHYDYIKTKIVGDLNA